MRPSVLLRLLGFGLCTAIGTIHAATVNVASFGDGSASLANAQAALNAAVAGDTIVFPLNGSATWSAGLVVGKAVTLNGNGTTLSAVPAGSEGFIYIQGFNSAALVRVTGFTFNLVNFSAREPAVRVQSVALENLRIDHNTFNFGYEQIALGGAKGVIDHNSFYNSRKAIDFNAGTIAQANASWDSMAAGTADALFIEDNSFIDNASYPETYTQEKIGTENGGKLVIRYNTFDFDAIAIPTVSQFPIITHGNAAGGLPATQGYWQQGLGARRGQSVVEVYNNTAHGPRIVSFAVFRGSANLVHNNVVDSVAALSDTPNITVYEEEQYETSNWSPSRTAWPAEDQVHNTFVWNNTFRRGGVANSTYFVVNPNSTLYIQQDRDYFLHAPQATGGREVFTGKNGASGSFPTDGSTYATQGTMTFVPTGPNAYFGYVPFTYPHPLAAPAAAPTTATMRVFVP